MPQRFVGRDPLIRVEIEAPLEQVKEEVELPGLSVTHGARCSREARAEISRGLGHGKGLDSSLQRVEDG